MALMVPEASGTSTYTVVLDTQPTGDVTITPESGDTMVATVSGALTFTTTDWNTAQTVTVTGVNDNDDNTGNARTATLTHTSSGADTTYNNLASIDSVTVTVQDDDDPTTGTVTVTLNPGIAGNDEVNIDEQAAGFTISGTVADGGMVEVTLDSGTPRGTTETGTTWTLDIPANDPEITGTSVVVEATAMLAGASGTVTRPLIVDLVRPTATYAPPPTLTVGTAITAITPVSPSADIARYNVQSGTIPPGLTLASDTGIISGTPTTADVATAPVTITLRDGAGNPTNVEIIFPMVAMGSQTLDGFAYGAGTATVGQTAPTVTAPTGAVVGSTLSYSTTSAGICTVNSSTGALTLDGAGDCVITVTASATTNYNEATADFTITVSAAAGVTVDPTELTVLEDGGMADYTLVLDTAPTADVTIAVASDTVTAATVSSASLTFTPTDWNTAQTVTVTGVNDDVDNPSDARTASLSHTPTSADAGYGSVVIDPVTVTVEDDDTAGVTVDLMALMVLEASGTSTYTVVLDTQPTGNVTITPESGDTMAATVSGALTFTTTDWNTAQTVTVTGVNDNDDNTGNARTATLTHTSSGADTTYNNLASIDSVTVTVQDDDDPTTGTVTVTLNPGIAGNDEVNIDEQAAGFTISGTVADGGMVEVTLDSGTPRGTTETGTTWTLDIPANDPEITGTSVVVEATAMLAGASGTVTRPLIVDLVRPTATYAPPPTLTVGTAITAITPVSPSADIARYNVQSGTIPPGLTLASDTGIISGTPTTADVATAPVTITLRDGGRQPDQCGDYLPDGSHGQPDAGRLCLRRGYRDGRPDGPDGDCAHGGGSRQHPELQHHLSRHMHG